MPCLEPRKRLLIASTRRAAPRVGTLERVGDMVSGLISCHDFGLWLSGLLKCDEEGNRVSKVLPVNTVYAAV